MRKVAIFDIDGTIFRSSLLIELIEALIEKGAFPKSAREVYEREYMEWFNRKGGYEEYIGKVVQSFVSNIKGVHIDDLKEASREVIDKQKHRVYRYTRDLIPRLKEDGYYLLAISQSPKLILDEFCKTLGFDKVYGRIYETGPEDRFTGAISDVHLIENKANIVHRAVGKENLTLEGSVGVGDSEGDISFLELVGQPICFNPNSVLYKHAKINGWKVVVERKDVIYEF